VPELPEVETIRRELNKVLPGLEVEEVICDDDRLLKPNPDVVRGAVLGARFVGVGRRAKLMVFVLFRSEAHPGLADRTERSRDDSGFSLGGVGEILKRVQNDEKENQNDRKNVQNDKEYIFLLCHLRMSGRLLFRNQDDPEDKYVEVKFKLSGGKELRFANARKFGYIKLASKEDVKKALYKFGPEPFDDLTLEKFKKILAGSRAMIKNLLMDQSKIAGVGNIYANDALFLAKVHPETPANKIPEEKVCKLYDALEQVLTEALETKGSSDQWYVDAYGEKGSYQENFKVYGKGGETCPREGCEGTIKRIKVGGRGTYYCSRCQNK